VVLGGIVEKTMTTEEFATELERFASMLRRYNTIYDIVQTANTINVLRSIKAWAEIERKARTFVRSDAPKGNF
jgi:hypothetical protein